MAPSKAASWCAQQPRAVRRLTGVTGPCKQHPPADRAVAKPSAGWHGGSPPGSSPPLRFCTKKSHMPRPGLRSSSFCVAKSAVIGALICERGHQDLSLLLFHVRGHRVPFCCCSRGSTGT